MTDNGTIFLIRTTTHYTNVGQFGNICTVALHWYLIMANDPAAGLMHFNISEMPSRTVVWLALLVLSPDHQFVVSRGVTYNKEKTALGTFTVTARRTANYDLMVTVFF